ncbi:MAG TPA: leucyl/phenylalanyl-tRNA--protein transferase [Myxococcales bacterium]|nr:leucyl/phenylalanyl-tRNA--protein transferase [Deltaproteobacteria bacterium]MBU53326.1 leucyl/phenylalanyl-tRNA--protein transferase [Deltaproteobacteria bacterium]HAA58533.1 leucyl/phenylalanyl-tRNA--protein transferase [Myxococcales bacterium]
MTKYEEIMQALRTGARRPVFPDEEQPDAQYIVALGAQLDTATLIEAYTKGYFPWTGIHPIPWHSPDPRLILRPQDFHASRSLKKLAKKDIYHIRYDHDFRAVMEACAYSLRPDQIDDDDEGTWITENLIDAYCELHEYQIAHSIEVYRGDKLCGGLYGLNFGQAFFGESMFSREPNTSKLALWAICQRLKRRRFDFIDCQQETEHLVSLGGVNIPRPEYIQRLQQALTHPSHHYHWGHPPQPTSTLLDEDT